ncbi:MAG TPA: base excision DNA repair protein [Terracidiphilus sp.]|nr:base excision DNA repair protein [Terracidiphilus sp.]
MTPRQRPGSAQRLRRMHDQLLAAYGPQHWWPAGTAFEVVLGAYLTQNTAWRSVERSLDNLRAAGAISMAGMRATPIDRLQQLIRPSGFFTHKAHAIKAFLFMLDREFEGSLESLAARPTTELRCRLLALPNVGPETADAILLYALNHPVPVADEYLRRIAERHGLLAPAPARNRKGYEALASLARQSFAGSPVHALAPLYNEFHALTVAVGKAHCGRVPECGHCPLASDLKWAVPPVNRQPAKLAHIRPYRT